jgi:hypothetical protein
MESWKLIQRAIKKKVLDGTKASKSGIMKQFGCLSLPKKSDAKECQGLLS